MDEEGNGEPIVKNYAPIVITCSIFGSSPVYASNGLKKFVVFYKSKKF
jgi:hypothetical protein